MDLRYLKKLMKLLATSEVDEIEVEEEGIRIRIAKSKNNAVTAYQPIPVNVPAVSSPPPAASSSSAANPAEPVAPVKAEVQYHEIKSPIVGTFYRAPAPDADPYVEVGQMVQPGTVLCIIEAMKLMNEIESDVAGRIAKICVENAKPVEYNQTLFLIEQV